MRKKDFVSGMQAYMSKLREEKRYSSAKSYQDALNSFKRFSGLEKIPYSFITKENLRRYQVYLLEGGCAWNTVSTYMRRIRCVYNIAVEEEEALYVPYLFKGIFTGIESKRKKALSQEEVYQLMTVRTEETGLRETQLAICLMFMFCGMAFVDFAHLRKTDIKNGVLEYYRQKTGTHMRVEVLVAAFALLEELSGATSAESPFLFPFLSGRLTKEEAYKEYNLALFRFNRDLKLLKKIAGITSDVTSYTIRHSFATTLKELDIPIEIISELLGHQSITTTQIYLKSFSLEKMTAVNKTCFDSVYNYVPKVG